MAMAETKKTDVPWFGRVLYHLLPYRRGLVLENMRRVFGDTEKLRADGKFGFGLFLLRRGGLQLHIEQLHDCE